MNHKNRQSQSGQMVLMVLLIMLVGLTIAAGVFLDSLTEVQLTTSQENSDRAFNAAEGGVEQYLAKDFTSLITASDSTDSNEVDVGNLKANVKLTKESTFKALIEENDVGTVNLDGMSTNATLTISWTKGEDQNPGTCLEGDNQAPAALIVEKWSNKSAPVVTRSVYKPFGCNIPSGVTPSTNAGENPYLSTIDFSVTPSDYLLRLRPVYNKATIAVSGGRGVSLPPQQISIESKSSITGSGESKAIKATKTFSDLPMIFDYVLYSGSAIVK
jgi:hypothetical protein